MLAMVGIFLTAALSDPSADPAIELRAKAIEAKIIAPCCWTQPVSQHYSNAAGEIREQIRGMLAAGKSRNRYLTSMSPSTESVYWRVRAPEDSISWSMSSLGPALLSASQWLGYF